MTVTSLQITLMPLICRIKNSATEDVISHSYPGKYFSPWNRGARTVFSFCPTLGLKLALINIWDRPLIAHQSAGSDGAVFRRFTGVKSPTIISFICYQLMVFKNTFWTSFTTCYDNWNLIKLGICKRNVLHLEVTAHLYGVSLTIIEFHWRMRLKSHDMNHGAFALHSRSRPHSHLPIKSIVYGEWDRPA